MNEAMNTEAMIGKPVIVDDETEKVGTITAARVEGENIIATVEPEGERGRKLLKGITTITLPLNMPPAEYPR
jgi:hypothetical protein